MKYSIYQIQLSKEDCIAINGMKNAMDHPKFAAHRAVICGDYAEGKGFYEKVAEIEASDLEHVFHIGNMGPEDKITRLASMHSVSVGDIVVTSTGEQYAVAHVGFDELHEELV